MHAVTPFDLSGWLTGLDAQPHHDDAPSGELDVLLKGVSRSRVVPMRLASYSSEQRALHPSAEEPHGCASLALLPSAPSACSLPDTFF